jgi:hypothetical protein
MKKTSLVIFSLLLITFVLTGVDTEASATPMEIHCKHFFTVIP